VGVDFDDVNQSELGNLSCNQWRGEPVARAERLAGRRKRETEENRQLRSERRLTTAELTPWPCGVPVRTDKPRAAPSQTRRLPPLSASPSSYLSVRAHAKAGSQQPPLPLSLSRHAGTNDESSCSGAKAPVPFF
jgi:hypothetical protein